MAGSNVLNYLEEIHGKKALLQILMQWCWAAFYGSGNSHNEPFRINLIDAIWFLLALWFASLIVNYACL